MEDNTGSVEVVESKRSFLETLKSQFRLPEIQINWWKELIFAVPVIALVWVALHNDAPAFAGLLNGVAVSVGSFWVAHVVRKLFIPEFSITRLYLKAAEDPLASAVTLFGIFYITGIIVAAVHQ
jgi:hypothetical protein